MTTLILRIRKSLVARPFRVMVAVTSEMPVRLVMPSSRGMEKVLFMSVVTSARSMVPTTSWSPIRSRAASLPETRILSVLRVMSTLAAVAPPPSTR